MTYIPRDIAKSVLNAVGMMPIIVLTGMRQTGKSTFLQNQPELKKYRYVTLDSFAQLAAAKENPLAFVDTGDNLIIDESQRCPELFIAIKQIVDRKRTPGQFILSGSANFLLMKNIEGRAKGQVLKNQFLLEYLWRIQYFPPISALLIALSGSPAVCFLSRLSSIAL